MTESRGRPRKKETRKEQRERQARIGVSVELQRGTQLRVYGERSSLCRRINDLAVATPIHEEICVVQEDKTMARLVVSEITAKGASDNSWVLGINIQGVEGSFGLTYFAKDMKGWVRKTPPDP